MGKPGKQAAAPRSPASPRLAIVQIQLPVPTHEALQRVLRAEGLTIQTYFAAQAADKLATAASRDPAQRTDAMWQVSSPLRDETRQEGHPDPAGSPAALAPGQTYQMPTGRYIHWCTVCRNLWRSHEASPTQCGVRLCHSPVWQTGRSRRHPLPASASALIPGQTYQMPTGRYIHWCTVCRNLWRSHAADPLHCGHRTCHARHWRTGIRQTS
jgi:hypothetical protein